MTDNSLLNNKEYKTITDIINSLYQTGTLARSPGFCLSVSDMMMKLLAINGIESRLQECSLTIRTKNPPSLSLVGHDAIFVNAFSDKNKDSLDSHIVLITETEIPFLIDLSVGIYDKNVPYICEPLNNTKKADLSYYNFADSEWFYNSKPYTSLPRLHQQSILNRIETDKEIFKSINKITTIVIIAASITSLNFIRGGFDFYQKYINKTNGFGPNKMDYTVDGMKH